jgi:hypothetical protein
LQSGRGPFVHDSGGFATGTAGLAITDPSLFGSKNYSEREYAKYDDLIEPNGLFGETIT